MVIPDGVIAIGDNTFYQCSGLTSVTIPGSVKSIGSSAFYGCSSLLDVYYNGTEADWAKIFSYGGNESLFYANRHTICEGAEAAQYQTKDWVVLTASITIEEREEYEGVGAVLHAKEIARTEAAKEEFVYF